MSTIESDKDNQYAALVIKVATDAGRILLQNGAEIFRVEETVNRITSHYGIEHGDVYVLTNGIFCSGKGEQTTAQTRILHVPVCGARLDRVIAVNQLSREIEKGKYTLDEVDKKLQEIESLPATRNFIQILSCGIGCGCFSVMFGGSLFDGLGALISGMFMEIFMLYIGSKMSKIVGAIFCAAIGTILCILACKLELGNSLSMMIIGAMMTLIPGVAFTNGIRDIADGDYLSGIVRLLDALLVFLGIAMGMAAILMLYHLILGGALL